MLKLPPTCSASVVRAAQHRVRKRLPLVPIRAVTGFFGAGLEMKAVRKRPHHRLQHVPVAPVWTTLRFRLKFPIEFENRGISQALTVACKQPR